MGVDHGLLLLTVGHGLWVKSMRHKYRAEAIGMDHAQRASCRHENAGYEMLAIGNAYRLLENILCIARTDIEYAVMYRQHGLYA